MNTTAREAATIPAPKTPVPATSRTAPPDALRHYILERRADGTLWELGRGGMGVTYKAIDVNLHCPVALKIIGPQCFGSEISRRRFIREARLAAQIRHPNVAAVYHLDTQDDDVFYSMEFVDGITADDWVKKRGPMSVELALDVAMQVCRALAAAHHIKLVHRDIKPSNIMLLADPADQGRVIVKVIDFGLALSQMNDAMTTTTTCAFVGTPQYSSPEQVDNLELDIRSDIYSLGCTLWFLLTGQAPFTGSVARVLSEQLTRIPPFESLTRVPKPATTLLRRMLEKTPEARPQTPMDLHSEICQCRESLSRQAATARLARIPFRAARNAWNVPGMRYAVYALLAGGCCASALWMSSQPTSTDTQVDQPLPSGVRLAASSVSLPGSTPLPEPPPAEPGASTSIVPGLPEEIAIPPHPPESLSLTSPEEPDANEPSIALAPMDLDDADAPFWMVLRPPDPATAMNLRNTEPVAMTMPGAVAADPKVSPKTTSRQTSKRRSQNVERRSSPFEPVQRAGRTVRNFVHRFF